MRGSPLSSLKLSAGAAITVRKGEPVKFWQSVQWQIPTVSGSTTASNVILPQWHLPSTFMTPVTSGATGLSQI